MLKKYVKKVMLDFPEKGKIMKDLFQFKQSIEKQITKQLRKKQEYQEAYLVLLQYWDELTPESKIECNKELNKVFKLNKHEQVKV